MAATTRPIIPELPIIRARGEGEQRATFFELFFDLVYVFAVTQLYARPADAPSPLPQGWVSLVLLPAS